MKIEISIPEACEIIAEHFEKKGFLIDDIPIKFLKLEPNIYAAYTHHFVAMVSITGNLCNVKKLS